MKKKDVIAVEKIIRRETRRNQEYNKSRFDAMDKRIGIMQHEIDVLYGADPGHLQTRDRSAWKTFMTDRITEIRKHHPEEEVRMDYRAMFGKLYKQMTRDFAVDLNAEKSNYMRRHNIPLSALRNVRMLNVVYDSPKLRGYFEETVEKYEGWYCPPASLDSPSETA